MFFVVSCELPATVLKYFLRFKGLDSSNHHNLFLLSPPVGMDDWLVQYCVLGNGSYTNLNDRAQEISAGLTLQSMKLASSFFIKTFKTKSNPFQNFF